MPHYIFTEDSQGRLGYVGDEFFSHTQAQDKADGYTGITHIIEGKDLATAKRYLRDKLSKKKGDLGQLYKNVRSVSDGS